MNLSQSLASSSREVVEIDALVRSLANLRHWSSAAATRSSYADDQGRRLFATAGQLREEAWIDSLAAAYRLFEIDAIHDSWIATGGRRA